MTSTPLPLFRRLPARLALKAALVLPLALAAHEASAVLVCVGACSCSAQTTSLLFANYNPLAYGNTDTTGTVTIKCGGVAGLLVPYTIALSTGGGSTFAGRRLAYGANVLSYNLYSDSGYTSIWGDGTASTSTASGFVLLDVISLLGSVTYTVYGRIPGRQVTTIPGGPYVDAVTVTITYQ
ncbi:spore coat protein U domain-containing protein [Roseateles chitosanitabidus]|uniref:spore coat protein U domain-containing protein n=1 Tax=Roseateles chitosanitabidus TaxID=65048 RepID=UPI00083331E1|nr:spore coat U domain-containing protein [Roseateles chitosanitabidus]MBO9689188.1 spore coat protein U domain-containing protein [Roseateles chitosanitabidus]